MGGEAKRPPETGHRANLHAAFLTLVRLALADAGRPGFSANARRRGTRGILPVLWDTHFVLPKRRDTKNGRLPGQIFFMRRLAKGSKHPAS
jgi:hypothetical protein